MKDWTKKLYFIVSSPRSGSSMLRNKLNDFQHMAVLPSDLRLIEFLKENKKRFKNDHVDLRRKFRETYQNRQLKRVKKEHWEDFIIQSAANETEFFRQVFALHTASVDKEINDQSIFIEKSPNNIYHIQAIRSIFPEAKIVYLLRDGRDVVASLNQKRWATHNTVANAKRWSSEQKIMLNNWDVMVRYEDLVREPETSMMRLLEQLNYANIAEVQKLREVDLKKEPSSIAEPGQAINTNHREKYLKTLSTIDRELEIIEYLCKNELVNGGYILSGKHFDLRFYRKFLFLYAEYATNELVRIVKGRNYN